MVWVRSNAFAISRKIAKVGRPLLKPFLTSLSSAKMWSFALLPGQKPAWVGWKKLFVSMYQLGRLGTVFSMVLHRQEINDMGWQEDGSSGFLFGFWIGTKMASF